MELLDYRGVYFHFFEEHLNCFLLLLRHVASPPIVGKSYNFFTVSPIFIFYCLENNRANRSEVISHYSFICIPLMISGPHWNQIDYILCSWRWRRSIQSAKTRPGADCGTDHQLLNENFRLTLKKVKKATRPFRYDLTQILYDYTVEVTNKDKG